MSDVAAAAHVSSSSVSLFLRVPNSVSPRMAVRIKRAIELLDYMPNQLAGGLAATRTRAIGVVVPSLEDELFSETVAAMQQEFARHNHQMLVGVSGDDHARTASLVRNLLSWSPSALVVTGSHHSEDTRMLLRTACLPVAGMWDVGKGPFNLQVGFSHFQAGQAIAQHIAALGAKRVAFVGARMASDLLAHRRCEGFRRTMLKARIEVYVADVLGYPSPSAGASALGDVLQRLPDVDTVACAHDAIALGVLFEASRRGIGVPQQLRVAGFGGLSFSEQCLPSLTTVVAPAKQIGARIAQLLMNRITAPECMSNREPEVVDLGFELVVRNSTGANAVSAPDGRA